MDIQDHYAINNDYDPYSHLADKCLFSLFLRGSCNGFIVSQMLNQLQQAMTAW